MGFVRKTPYQHTIPPPEDAMILRHAAVILPLALAFCLCGCSGSELVGDSSPAASSQIDRSLWTPKQPVSQVVMSRREKMRLRSRYLKVFASNVGIRRPPNVALVEMGYPEDMKPKWAACVTSAGFDAQVSPDGIQVTVAPVEAGKRSALAATEWICTAKFSDDPRLSLAPTKAQLSLVWEYMTGFVIPCLNSQGVASEQPPSEADFVTSGGQGWRYPDIYLTRPNVVKICNPRVPSKVLLGDSP